MSVGCSEISISVIYCKTCGRVKFFNAWGDRELSGLWFAKDDQLGGSHYELI